MFAAKEIAKTWSTVILVLDKQTKTLSLFFCDSNSFNRRHRSSSLKQLLENIYLLIFIYLFTSQSMWLVFCFISTPAIASYLSTYSSAVVTIFCTSTWLEGTHSFMAPFIIRIYRMTSVSPPSSSRGSSHKLQGKGGENIINASPSETDTVPAQFDYTSLSCLFLQLHSSLQSLCARATPTT